MKLNCESKLLNLRVMSMIFTFSLFCRVGLRSLDAFKHLCRHFSSDGCMLAAAAPPCIQSNGRGPLCSKFQIRFVSSER